MRNILFAAFISLLALVGCSENKPVKTIENLKEGFRGETTASAKYAAFAIKAREEGHDTIAKLFDAVSKSESIHAANHKKVLDKLGVTVEPFTPKFEVKSTAENLQAAVDGETYEITTMYPKFMKDAEMDRVNDADKSFSWAFDTEMKHQDFYNKALAAFNAKAEKSLPYEYAVCPVCGNTYDKANLDPTCAFCGTSKDKFLII